MVPETHQEVIKCQRCKMVAEQRCCKIPVTTCKLVKEEKAYQVPETTCTMEPYTVTYKICRKVPCVEMIGVPCCN
jgi:hypothetical protein